MSIFFVNGTADTIDADDGVTTLREAIIAANESPGFDRIVFSRSLQNQTITLDDDLPTLTDSVVINGQTGLTIDGAGHDAFRFNADHGYFRVSNLDIQNADQAIRIEGDGNRARIYDTTFNGNADSVVVDGSAQDVTLSDVEIRGTTAAADGAIDFNADHSSLNVWHSLIDGEGVSDAEALEIDGDFATINLYRTIIQNSGVGGNEGAVDADNGDDLNLSIRKSAFLNNGDGALTIDSDRAQVKIQDTRFEGQDVGIEVDADDVFLAVNRSSFVENGDGILVDGESGPAQDLTARVHNSEFINNSGDGIDNNGEATDFTVSRSSFEGNGDKGLEGPSGFNIVGGFFRDDLEGSDGDDTFTGGWGIDTFGFSADKNNSIFGDDFITDFNNDRLRIQIDNLDGDDLVIAERDLDLVTVFVDEDGDLSTDDRIFQGNIQFASETIVENLSEDDLAGDSDAVLFV